MKKVSADTVAELSAAAALVTPDPAPTAEELIAQIRSNYERDIKALSGSARGSAERTAFGISLSKMQRELETFEEIVANVPAGFRLTPVLYTDVSSTNNDKAYDEYRNHVRRQFFRFLGENHAQALTDLGICAAGIELMKQGLDPVDPQGRQYDISTDHIIERGGGGKLTVTKEIDPEMPAGSRPTYLINHFANFVLMPAHIHQMKNKLNELQDIAKADSQKSQWVLMLVPVATPNNPGYVAQPQTQGLSTHKQKLGVKRMNATDLAYSAAVQLKDTLENESQRPFRQAALKTMSVSLNHAFNEASKPRQDMQGFLKFYKCPVFTTVRNAVEQNPDGENKALRNTIKQIDNSLNARFNRAAQKPAKKNGKQPKQSKRSKKNKYNGFKR